MSPTTVPQAMHYRTLGATGLLVSVVGLEADPLRDQPAEAAIEALRTALARGISLLSWSVGDALDDLEPLIASALGADLGRFALIPRLDVTPPLSEVASQVEAVRARLGDDAVLVAAAFPEALPPESVAALGPVRAARWTEAEIQLGDAVIARHPSDEGAPRVRLIAPDEL